jgi:hypothetical protein
MADAALPEPMSDALTQLVGGSRQRALYGLLYRRRSNPPTAAEISYFLSDVAGEQEASLSAVLAPIEAHFAVDVTAESSPRYLLAGWKSADEAAIHQPISLRLRAEVLAPQRCAQCGRTPSTHGIELSPAQRIPINWGGTASRENLEPLCEECAIGRQQYFAKWDHAADQIREVANRDDPRERLGELLRAMSPAWVRADLLEAVACAKDHQDDWTRRLRDLRFLGWDYEHQNRKSEGARTWAYYRLTQTAPWPDNIHAAIKAEEARRSAARAVRRTASASD